MTKLKKIPDLGTVKLEHFGAQRGRAGLPYKLSSGGVVEG